MQRSVRLAAGLAVAGAAIAISHAFLPILPNPGGYTSLANFKDPALVWGSFVAADGLAAATSISCCFIARSSRRRLAIGAGLMGSLAAFAARGLVSHMMLAFAVVHAIPAADLPGASGLWLAATVFVDAMSAWAAGCVVLVRASRVPATPPMPVPP